MLPVPGGTGKFIDSVLQNSNISNKQEVREYLAAYWSAREAMMNLMRLQSGGKQGARGQFQAEAAIRQFPAGGTPSSDIAAKQIQYIQEGLDVYRSGIPDTMPGYKKESSWKEKQGASTQPGSGAQPGTQPNSGGDFFEQFGGKKRQ